MNDSLGIEIGASSEANTAGFKLIRTTTTTFTSEEFEVWLRILAEKGKSPGMSMQAGKYAKQIVDDDENNKGWFILKARESYWDFLKPAHRTILEHMCFLKCIVTIALLGRDETKIH